jgi:hypothetical protein
MRNSTKRTLREFNYKNLRKQEQGEIFKFQKESFENKLEKGEK